MSDLTTQYMGYTIRYDEHDNGWYVYNKDADLMNEYVIKSLAEAKQSVDRHIQGNLPSIPVLKDTFLDGIVEGVARLDPFGEVWFSGPKGEFVVDPIQLLHDTPKNRQTMEAIHDLKRRERALQVLLVRVLRSDFKQAEKGAEEEA